ncbi:MAG: aminotransferase class IV [Eubacteriales bacterium]|jgi:D-amino acid aminotransferase
MNIVCVNGSFIGSDQPAINPLDQGLLYGFGLFETVLVKEGYPSLIRQHINRLFSSAEKIGLTIPFSIGELIWLVEQTIKKNNINTGSIRLTITAGNDKSAISTALTLIIFGRQPLAYTHDHYKHGLTAGFADIKRNEYSPLVRLKTINYLENLLAKRHAQTRGWDEALFLNTSGNLAEGSMSNIFLVKNGGVITPNPGEGLLPGIIRHYLLEKCIALGIPAEERIVSEKELWEADECFLTNSLMGVIPLVKINGKKIGDGRPGIISRKLNSELNMS